MPATNWLAVACLLLAGLAACTPTSHAPAFASTPFEPFNRTDTVAIAVREWRLFGQPLDGNATPGNGKPERAPGLWQRVGEYWWIGLNAGEAESSWTGKHDQSGRVFPASVDEEHAWSAAFISYVMRIAGAGDRFPYAANHATYVNAAAAGRSPILRAHAPEAYAPKLGDLLCHGRHWATRLRFADLPTRDLWPGHCAIVVGGEPRLLDVIGGNVDDAVAMSRVPVDAHGRLVDSNYPWFVVLEVRYDADAEPRADE